MAYSPISKPSNYIYLRIVKDIKINLSFNIILIYEFAVSYTFVLVSIYDLTLYMPVPNDVL